MWRVAANPDEMCVVGLVRLVTLPQCCVEPTALLCRLQGGVSTLSLIHCTVLWVGVLVEPALIAHACNLTGLPNNGIYIYYTYIIIIIIQ
jgi:hypothetical protein